MMVELCRLALQFIVETSSSWLTTDHIEIKTIDASQGSTWDICVWAVERDSTRWTNFMTPQRFITMISRSYATAVLPETTSRTSNDHVARGMKELENAAGYVWTLESWKGVIDPTGTYTQQDLWAMWLEKARSRLQQMTFQPSAPNTPWIMSIVPADRLGCRLTPGLERFD